jgi:uncharacterized phage protein (TIGR01671 family)
MYWFDITWGNYEQGNGWIGMIPITEERLRYFPSNQTCISPESVEFMEYTGKSDKNGKCIWEGDILHYISKKGYSSLGLYLVEWNEEDCCFVCERSTPCNFLHPDLWCVCEIVGNIFENPELLDGGNDRDD